MGAVFAALLLSSVLFAPEGVRAQAVPDGIVSSKSTSTCHNTNSFNFYSSFSGASYYRYVWDTSPTHTWTHAETQWSSGVLNLTAASEGTWYFHAMAYDSGGVPGTDIHLPLIYDITLPVVSGFSSLNSSGGTVTESQYNNLASGVTVQITVQDALAGLIVTTAAVPGDMLGFPGGVSVAYSNDAGRNWAYDTVVLSSDGAKTSIFCLAVYNGRLYAGQTGSTGDGDVLVYDGSSWSVSYNGSQTGIYSLAAYNGKLYAGQGQGTGLGDIYVFDGASWSLNYDTSRDITISMAVYNGKLYAGWGDDLGEGDIYAYDGTSWVFSYNGGQEYIRALAVYNNKLYAGQGSGTGDGDVLSYNGTSWGTSYNGAQEYITSLSVYNGKLYAAQGSSTGDGDVFVYDGSSWTTSYNGSQEVAYLGVYGGKLYAGEGTGTGDGDMLAFDGTRWGRVANTDYSYVYALTGYDGSLFTAMGSGTPMGDILRSAPAAPATLTGTDGTTAAQTLSAVVSLSASTNTQTCAGAEPCGATNQVIFTAMDRAGNVRRAGPYAVLLSVTPSAAEVVPGKSTGVWYHTSSFTFSSSFKDAAYYRYAWDTSATHSWTYSEPQWTAWVLSPAGVSGAAGNYLHLLPYNIEGTYGTSRDIGPFYLDASSPVASGFVSYSSTAGVMGEAQVNGLLSGVTVQVTVQDILSGLLLSTAAVPADLAAGPGGFGMMYSQDSGTTWTVNVASVSFDGAEEYIFALAAYNGKLYAGQGNGTGNGDVYVYDGVSWSLSYDGAQEAIYSLAVYNGKLYAGQGYSTGDGDVLVFDGSTWGVSLDNPFVSYVYAMTEFQGKLYAAFSSPGSVYSFDGSSWTKVYDYNTTLADMAVYDGKLYLAAMYYILVFDGNYWGITYDAGATYVKKLAVYNNRLYAGLGGSTGTGDVLVYDGKSWAMSFDGTQEYIVSLFPHDGRLYAGQGSGTGDGRIYVLNGATWTLAYSGLQEYIYSMAAYNGKLYAGQAYSSGDGDVIEFAPASSVTLSGSDGSVVPQTLAGTANFKLSATADTCSGTFPCSATNQVIFTATDKAGNVRTAGPYAVLVAGPPNSSDVDALKSTGVWHSSGTFPFVSGFSAAAYYRYVWDNSVSHDWTGGETQWPSGVLSLDAAAEGADWYFHAVPYDILGSSGPDRHIGPLRFDATPPAVSAFASFSSTGGLLGESQFNDLLAGVTVQLVVQDLLSGLAVSTLAPVTELPGGLQAFSVAYSSDAGHAWNTLSTATSYNASQEAFYSLAVYGQKLYAGQASEAGDGDVFSFDGTSWVKTFDGTQETISCLAVYQGKLYAGQGTGTGDGDVYVYDGISWQLSYDGPRNIISSLAVYKDKLYAGQGSSSGYGDVLVFDGSSWSVSYDGAQEYIFSLAVHQGRLYAGQGNGAGDGDVLVYDGINWTVSYDGAQEIINTLAVYDGKLYAGQGYNAGDGDVLAFDGTAWGVSYDGTQEGIYSLQQHGGKLYAGQGNGSGDGDLLVYDGASWTLAWNGPQEGLYSLASYKGRLYSGQGISSGDGDVLEFSPFPAVLSGADGTIALQTASSTVRLALSSNTQTCGGVEPCGATNQVRFYFADLAGNVTRAGPFAVVTRIPPSAQNVVSLRSTGTWYNAAAGDFTFTSDFQQAVYYRYAWDASPTRVWAHDETQWLSGNLALAGADGQDRYLHLLPHDLSDSSGTPVDLGPFRLDSTAPSVSGYNWVSSTGGLMSESQFLTLATGATFQVLAQDSASGLMVSSYIPTVGFEGGSLPSGFSSGGNLPWTVSSLIPYAGSYAVRSGNIGNSQSSWLRFQGELQAGFLNFWFKLSSQSSSDYLRFYIDGEQRSAWSGVLAWSEVSYEVAAGQHILEWVYVKDASSYSGDDEAWVDQITFPGTYMAAEYSLDAGTTWAEVRDFSAGAIPGLALTGVNGTVAQQTASLFSPAFKVSTNTQTCGGVEPCGATNQIRFGIPDRAGNTTYAGPYAVLLTLAPEASDVAVSKSTGVWHNTSSFTFTSAFPTAVYYRYALTNSPAHVWTFSETQWLSGALTLEIPAGSSDWYFHALPYDILNGSGTPASLGPFRVETASPALSGFYVYSSTGGIFPEGEFVDLAAGVTAQILVQDVLSGLLVSTSVPPAGGTYGPGGFGVLFSKDAGQTWSSDLPATTFNGAQEYVFSLAAYGGKLYAGQGIGTGDGDVLVFDGSSWQISYNGTQEVIRALVVYDGKLYAGQGSGTGDGDVLVYDGNSWAVSHDGSRPSVLSLSVYAGRLYAGLGGSTGDGDVMVFDGSSWTLSYAGAQEGIYCLAVYDGKLYAGQGYSNTDGDIYVFDGVSWTKSFEGSSYFIRSLAVYNGKLYAGQEGSSTTGGDIYSFDGKSWINVFEGVGYGVQSLAVHDGKLYAGLGKESYSTVADIYVFDGVTWRQMHDGPDGFGYFALAPYNGRLYAGSGWSGDILVFSPAAVSSLTGTDGTASQQTLSTRLDLRTSTNTQTCGGISPCGATNQVKFFAMDLAGNVAMGGPYALLISSTPSADDAWVSVSTGGWYTAVPLSVFSPFSRAAYFRYSLDAAASREWTFAEPVWSSGTLSLGIPADGTDWHVHLLPYDLLDSSGAARSIGPFRYDAQPPVFSAFASYSSTGGLLGEAQFNDLVSGVTIQISVQDVLSGLLVSSAGVQGWGPFAPGGFRAEYSADSGATWQEDTLSVSFDGVFYEITCFAVYNGKLYAGQGRYSGAGDIYAFDGVSWTLVYNGSYDEVSSLAVFEGKLYAGMGNASSSGDIYVYDGATWVLSYNGQASSVHALSVYGGRLYAALGGYAGVGDILVHDGAAWSVSYDGDLTYAYALAVYEGRLYAGFGGSTGDGDIMAYDGHSWTLSYDGSQEGFFCLAVYDGKLYAGQGNGSGDDDTYVYDGSSWSLSRAGSGYIVYSLAVSGGRLFSGGGFPPNYGGTAPSDIFIYDGSAWTQLYDGTGLYDTVSALAAYGGRLYAGMGDDSGKGDILAFSPVAVASMTGTDASTSQELLRLSLDLRASVNSVTCGGVAPCAATNQVRFKASDMAGNVVHSGPYAVITSPEPDASEVTASLTTGTWNTASSSAVFSSSFLKAAYYRYVWDTSASHEWTYAESAWTSAAHSLYLTPVPGAANWLHLLPYNVSDSSGSPRDIGPFNFDGDLPAASSFAFRSSTGGLLSEPQFSDLLSGVTVQLSWQDPSSGLAVSTYTLSGLRYSNDAGATWVPYQWEQIRTGLDTHVHAMAVHQGKLYVGTGSGTGRVYSYDGYAWALVYDGPDSYMNALASYNGLLFAGGDSGNVMVYDGNSWKLSFDSPAETVKSFQVYNGKLYVGTGYNTGAVYAYDGASWVFKFSYADEVSTMAVYDGKLYAGFGNDSGEGDIYAYDGSSWVLSYNGSGSSVMSLAAYAGKLYAAMITTCEIYQFDGTVWSLNFTGGGNFFPSLVEHDGKLYAGLGYGSGEGDVYEFNGSSWSSSFNSSEDTVGAMAVYRGEIYVGTGYHGHIYKLRSYSVPEVTGVSGTTEQQVMSGLVSLSASTNTETCGGAAPCGATNQVKFYAADTAGNLSFAGPYAVLAAPEASAADAAANFSTGAWTSRSTFSFNSSFIQAAYYRYVWDASPAREWVYTEPQWLPSSATLSFQAAEGANYLHLLPYNVLGSSGAPRDLGPFLFEAASPTAAAFFTISSTGGALSEAQFNALVEGVTAQLTVRDLLSGLSVSTWAAVYEGFETGTLPLGWETGGNLPWYTQSGVQFAGGHAARAGLLAPSQVSWLQATVQNFVPGQFSFRRYGQAGDSWFRFWIDGASKGYWFAETSGWVQESYAVSAGSHTLLWQYLTNSNPGLNLLLLDDITFLRRPSWAEYSLDAGVTWKQAGTVSLTGAEGSTEDQTLSALFTLRASSNTETCGGSSSCGATNQVRFYVSDQAGNVRQAGPFAVITSPVPHALDVQSGRSTGTWYSVPKFTFQSEFFGAAYYRYVWDTSDSYEWTYAEPQWGAGNLSLSAVTSGAGYYLHLLPYNVSDSSGAPRHLGPFFFEGDIPSGSSFATVSSTGGLLSESQPTALSAGVTVQFTLQDVLSGLLVSEGGAPSEYPFQAGGFRISYSRDAGATWSSESTVVSHYSSAIGVHCLTVHDGKLYAGHGEDDELGQGDIFVYDGSSWSLSYEGQEVSIRALASYGGKLYAAQYGWDEGDGDILVFDGGSWSVSYDAVVYGGIESLWAFGGKLYAGTLSWDVLGDILVFDGGSWKLDFATGKDAVAAFATYNGELFAGVGYDDANGNGDIYVRRGNSWEGSFDGNEISIRDFAVYGGKLYAAQYGWDTGDAVLLVYDGEQWTQHSTFDVYVGVASLSVYNGRLFAGIGDFSWDPDGEVYSYDGEVWTRIYDGAKMAIKDLAVYDGSLYGAEYGYSPGEASVLRLSDPVRASITGSDGTTAAQTFSAVLDLSPSADGAVCAGVAPCSATNQVKFTATDRAGNVGIYGPYAVIAASAASAADAVAERSTGAWHNTPGFSFRSGFGGALYYRYAWDTSPSRSWTGTEPQWTSTSPALHVRAAAEGADHYLHLLPYNYLDGEGPPRDIGPFRFEMAAPAPSGFSSVSSTGGYMSESQENDLAAQVQVRLSLQDILSGLSVLPDAPHGPAGFPAGGFSVRYSNDAGATWSAGVASLSFAGPTEDITALAVYNGKLYAGQGYDDMDDEGDVYVYDGNAWALSLNGYKVAIRCLAVYDGKLYAGQYGWEYGDGRVYVFDGNTWEISLAPSLAISAQDLAVYNGKLYAGLYGWWDDDEGDVYVFDGKTWRISFDGITDGIAALAVYDGKLYAGEGYWGDTGEGDVRVFDGNSWKLSFDGGATTINSLAVYDGRLFAGQTGAGGDGDVYVYDGSAWVLSLDGETEGFSSLCVHNGRLYAGAGYWGSEGDGDMYAYDGASWRLEFEGPAAAIRAMASYGGALYYGETGYDPGDGRVMRLLDSPSAALTGTEGTASPQTLSASLALKVSTNTETCGGVSPCGATNQVVFAFTDTAGNSANAGPYAIISVPPLSADDVTPLRSTGVWYHTSTFGFTSAQVNAAYYRYAWIDSPSYAWTYSEPVWSTPDMDLSALSSAATWYLHLLPYNSGGTFGASRVIGPFLYDGVAPSPSFFHTYNSTGGVIAEPGFNNLTSAVTAQLSVWEGLSGLSLRFYEPGQDVFSAAARSFEEGTLPAQMVTGGNAPWYVVSGTAAAGTYSARSGDITEGGQSYMYFSADTTEGEIFYYRLIDTESRYDNLRFSIDGVEVSSRSGGLPWAKESFPVSAGRHTFMWVYVKDLWDTELSDTVWVDQIELPSTATVQVQYSTSAGNNWLPVQSTVPAASPYLSLTGFDGTLSTQTFKVYNMQLAPSTSAVVCAGASPCDATNQVRFFLGDHAGNLMTAGPYSVLVDTAPTQPVSDLSTAAVYHTSATIRWTAPLDIGPGILGVTTGWYRVDYATYSGYAFSSSTFKVEIATLAVIGSTQAFNISGLWPHTTYYAMVYPGDRAYNFTASSSLLVIAPLVPSTYCGLKMYDGVETVSLGCEPEGTLNSDLRISRHGVTFGVIMVDVADPAASRIKMQTPEGVKAVRKY